MIIFCPSTADLGGKIDNAKDGTTEFCVGYNHKHGGKCARAVDASYAYLGWVLDQTDYTSPNVTLGSLTNLMDITSFIPDVTINPADEVNAQFGWTLNSLLKAENIVALLGCSVEGMLPAADKDVKVPVGLGNGGGQSDTVYRLREGIERFLITDINNPAASAQAQSTVYIMFDQISTNPADFNHVPGGSNILYMDGHVAFQRYEEKGNGPVNGPMARLIGLLTGM